MEGEKATTLKELENKKKNGEWETNNEKVTKKF